jgi:hypothetical protein
MGWMALLFPKPLANEKLFAHLFLKKSNCSFEIDWGSSTTIHCTISEQGGVVNEPE